MNKKYFQCAVGAIVFLFILTASVVSVVPSIVRADDSSSVPFSIPLAANTWNLISIPVNVQDESVAGVLGDASNSVDTIYTYIPESTDGSGSAWKVYNADHPELSTLKTMEPGFGYFVHTNSAASISGRGTLFLSSSTPPSRHLVDGWNLVGVFEPQSIGYRDIDSVFDSIGFSGVDYLALWKLDPSNSSFTTPDSASQGDAFWMLVNGSHTYAPSNF